MANEQAGSPLLSALFSAGAGLLAQRRDWRAALGLTLAALALTQIGLLLRVHGRAVNWLHGFVDVGLAWLLGHVAFGQLTLLSALTALIFSFSYAAMLDLAQGASATRRWLLALLILVIVLVLLQQPIAAVALLSHVDRAGTARDGAARSGFCAHGANLADAVHADRRAGYSLIHIDTAPNAVRCMCHSSRITLYSSMPLLLLILLATLVALFLYWQLVWAEGAYFGKGAVAWLYNLVAHRYNRIKQYDADDDARFLGEPLMLSLQGVPLRSCSMWRRAPRACRWRCASSRCFTARSSRWIMRGACCTKRRSMCTTYRDRVTWVWQHAVPLPFDDNTFDLVTCLEALEFMPSTPAALREFIRVLKPGGLLLVTNRTGSGRRLMPGKTYRQEQFEALLQSLQQTDITTQVWQYDYDLVWSIKPG